MQGARVCYHVLLPFCAVVFALSAAQRVYAFDPDAPGGGVTPPVPVVSGLPTNNTAAAAAPVNNGPAVLPTDVRPTSLFITDSELAQIQKAIEAYLRSRTKREQRAEDKAKDFLNQLTDNVEEIPKAPVKPVPFIYPQFYLAQISYQNEKDWVVWINGKKFGAHLPNSDSWIRFIDVNKEFVIIEWRPQNMKLVNNSWMMLPLDDSNNSGVIVNNELDIVTFTLKQNQTFSSYAMQVVEGKVQPMQVMLVNGEPVSMGQYNVNAASKAAAVAAKTVNKEAEVTGSSEANDDNTGAEALDRTYKKLGVGK